MESIKTRKDKTAGYKWQKDPLHDSAMLLETQTIYRLWVSLPESLLKKWSNIPASSLHYKTYLYKSSILVYLRTVHLSKFSMNDKRLFSSNIMEQFKANINQCSSYWALKTLKNSKMQRSFCVAQGLLVASI